MKSSELHECTKLNQFQLLVKPRFTKCTSKTDLSNRFVMQRKLRRPLIKRQQQLQRLED